MSISLPLVPVGEDKAILVDVIIRHGVEMDLTAEECDFPRVLYLTDTKEFVVSRGDGTWENITREINEVQKFFDIVKNNWDSKANSNHNHDSKYLKLSGGTLTGNLFLKSDPTSDDMAANKKYVDDAISLAIGDELGGIY